MANNVQTKKATNVVEFDDSILLEYAGAGQENMSQEDMMIPRISVL